MKKATESKTWSITLGNSEIEIRFDESVDIRKAFDAIPPEKATWMTYMRESDTKENTICVDCYFESFGFNEEVPALIKAIAETFPSIPSCGSAWYQDRRCYDNEYIDFAYSNGLLQMTEKVANDDNGYFCPDCGYWIAGADVIFNEDEGFECDDCEKTLKVSDLKYIPLFVEHHEIKVG